MGRFSRILPGQPNRVTPFFGDVPAVKKRQLALVKKVSTTLSSQLGPFTSLHLDKNEQISNTTKMAFIPLALMIDRSVNIFKRARTDVLRAEMLVRQLLADKSNAASGATDMPPLLDVDAVLFDKRDLSCRCFTTPLLVTMQLTS